MKKENKNSYLKVLMIILIINLLYLTKIDSWQYTSYCFAAFSVIFLTSTSENIYILFALIPSFLMLRLPNEMLLVPYLVPILLIKHLVINLRNILNRDNLGILVMFCFFLAWEFMHAFFYADNLLLTSVKLITSLTYIFIIIIDRGVILDFKKITIFITTGIFIVSIVGILDFIQYYKIGYNRFGGVNEDPNTYSCFISIIIAGWIYILEYSTSRFYKRIIYIVVLGLFCFGAISLSRAYLINMSIVISFLILRAITLNRNAIQATIIIVGICIVLYTLNKEKLLEIINIYASRFQQNSIDDMTGNRITIYQDYLNVLGENILRFLFGTGIDNYRNLYVLNYAVHNTYLETILSFGLIGTVLISFMVVKLFVVVKAKYCVNKINIFSYVPVLCLALTCMSLSLLIIDSFYYYLFYCALCIVSFNNKTENKLLSGWGKE